MPPFDLDRKIHGSFRTMQALSKCLIALTVPGLKPHCSGIQGWRISRHIVEVALSVEKLTGVGVGQAPKVTYSESQVHTIVTNIYTQQITVVESIYCRHR